MRLNKERLSEIKCVLTDFAHDSETICKHGICRKCHNLILRAKRRQEEVQEFKERLQHSRAYVEQVLGTLPSVVDKIWAPTKPSTCIQYQPKDLSQFAGLQTKDDSTHKSEVPFYQRRLEKQ